MWAIRDRPFRNDAACDAAAGSNRALSSSAATAARLSIFSAMTTKAGHEDEARNPRGDGARALFTLQQEIVPHLARKRGVLPP